MTLNKIQIEKWKYIYSEYDYQVSNKGRIKNNKTNNIISIQKTDDGYSIVSLNLKIDTNKYKTKKELVSRLVAIAFVHNPFPDKYKIVDHIDRNIDNNDSENLRWVNDKKSCQNRNDRKCKNVLQLDKKGKLIKEWESSKEICKENSNFVYKTLTNYILSGREYYGHYYKYKNPEKVINKNATFIKIGKFKNYDFNNYLISNYGDIKNIKTKRTLNLTKNKGYITTMLKDLISKKLVKVYIHVLVAWKFVDGADLNKQVNHKDKNKQNNHFSNLEWLTPKEHSIHTFGKKGL